MPLETIPVIVATSGVYYGFVDDGSKLIPREVLFSSKDPIHVTQGEHVWVPLRTVATAPVPFLMDGAFFHLTGATWQGFAPHEGRLYGILTTSRECVMVKSDTLLGYAVPVH